jgi:hypothetical protein
MAERRLRENLWWFDCPQCKVSTVYDRKGKIVAIENKKDSTLRTPQDNGTIFVLKDERIA